MIMGDRIKLAFRRRVDRAGPNSPQSLPIGVRGWPGIIASALGWGLILLWVGGWVVSFQQNRFLLGSASWVPMLPMIAGDFQVHIDHVARVQAAGIDPYHVTGDWVCGLYPYPPMIARSFAWVIFFNTPTAAFLWQGTLALIMGISGVAVARSRCDLGLDSIPRPVLIAALLFSTPVIFAIERAQSDPMILPALILAAWLLRRKASWADIGVGALLGLMAWLKYYPALAVMVLLVMGRRSAMVAFVVIVALVGIADRDGIRESIHHAQGIQSAASAVRHPVHDATHSILENWHHLRFVRRSPILRQIPAEVAAVVILLPILTLVSFRVSRSPRRDALIFPSLCWLVALATFALPYSNDYNLTPLPVAALMVWSRRDRWPVHLLLLASLLWSQPFRLPLSGDMMLGFKLAALFGVGLSLAARAVDISEPAPTVADRRRSGPHLPSQAEWKAMADLDSRDSS